MKRIIRNYIIACLSIMAVIFQSCYTKKPIASYTSSPDYNKRIEVRNAQYVKKGNAFNIVVTVGLAGGGAAGGYFTPMIQRQTENGKQPVRVANAAIGAVVGLTVGYLIDQIAGKNKKFQVVDPNEWIKKANNQYHYVKGTDGNFTFIHSSIEPVFQVKNPTDVWDFKKTFPNSLYTDNVVLSGIKNLSRNDLPTLIEAFPAEKTTEQAKIKYITSSRTFDEAMSAIQKYTVNYDVESHLLNLIRTADNSIKFLKLYPTTTYRKIAILNAFKESKQSKQEWIKLQTAYGNDIYLNKSDFANISNEVKQNYYYAMYELSNPNTLDKFDKFNMQYSWLDYSYKKNDVLSLYWDMVNNSHNSGLVVIEQFKYILAKREYENLALTDVDIKNVMEKKFKEEVEKKVFIRSKRIIGSHSEEWERWKSSQYTAGIVNEYGTIQFIIYGEVENTSKFDLPVEIAAGGSLTKTTRLTGQGGFMSGLIGFAEMLGAPTTQVDLIAAEVGRCFYPALPSKGKILYAILLDFGKGTTRSGVNILDAIKMSSELSITHDTIGFRFNQTVPTEEQLQKQNTWLQFAHQGLPSSELVDFIRNEAVRQEIWDIRHEEYQERLRRAQASQSYSSSSSDDEAKKKAETCLQCVVDDSKTEYFEQRQIFDKKGKIVMKNGDTYYYSWNKDHGYVVTGVNDWAWNEEIKSFEEMLRKLESKCRGRYDCE